MSDRESRSESTLVERPPGSSRGPSAPADDTVRQTPDEVAESLEQSLCEVQPPARVPGFTVLKRLGEGAYGSVWLAREENTGKRVAIKYYTHRGGLDWSLLNREVEKLAVLSTSRNIVRLLEVGWDADPPHYVMEYLDNGSLAALLADGAIPAHEAVRIAKAVLHALVHAHGSGILHCDLKPANVLLDSNFEPRICDFGQSRLSHEQSPALGTLFYMAPEQADLHAVPDARWDVYALGAILYHMLSGHPPYRTPEQEQRIRAADALPERLAEYRRVLRSQPKPAAHRRVSGVDRRLAEIVDRCLEVDPAKRYPNAQAVLDALERRDRYRSKRPMILLGIIGPLLLLLAMTPIVAKAMRSAVESARANITDRALESDALSARILARSLERDLEDRTEELIRVAETPEMRRVAEQAFAQPWPERAELLEPLAEAVAAVESTRELLGRPSDTSWFLTDRNGVQRWRTPYNDNTMDQSFEFRDYYRGLNLHANGTEADDPAVIHRSHISEAFRSRATLQFMVAISVPVWDLERRRVIGVLARTTHLGELLTDYKRPISGRQGDEQVSRIIALLDSRDWELLDHPWMTTENLQSQDVLGQLRVDTELAAQLEELVERRHRQQTTLGYDRDAGYRDPVGRLEREFAGEWLAAFSPIGETGWLAVVQERRSVAERPVDEMQSNMLRFGLLALVVSGGLIGLLWYFVSRALGNHEPEGALRNGAAKSA
jgi:eukaryotic-like serine/threonine-protein kinase